MTSTILLFFKVCAQLAMRWIYDFVQFPIPNLLWVPKLNYECLTWNLDCLATKKGGKTKFSCAHSNLFMSTSNFEYLSRIMSVQLEIWVAASGPARSYLPSSFMGREVKTLIFYTHPIKLEEGVEVESFCFLSKIHTPCYKRG